MITGMVVFKVDIVINFEWQKQLRYYWDFEMDNCVVRMFNSLYVYGYEYFGALFRFVVIFFIDRCYLCLMGVLQLDLGGVSVGFVGIGKIEIIKDFVKSFVKQCVVFNCFDGFDYKVGVFILDKLYVYCGCFKII